MIGQAARSLQTEPIDGRAKKVRARKRSRQLTADRVRQQCPCTVEECGKERHAVADAEYFADESTATLSRRRRHFTLVEANRTLPLVRRIVKDVVETHGRARELHAMLDTRLSRTQREQVEHDLDQTVQRLQALVDELTEVGAEIKDYRLGLVDFITRHQGRDVCLCWRQGEGDIAYWHELDGGFQGRQPVEELG
jgi:hypothetical protein